ncbi:MAG: outer membrane beta-barrel protein [Bacteroidota bacterium]
MHNYLLLFSLILLTLAPAFAQESITITGKLVDSESGEPVVGANVLAINVKDSADTKFAVSDANGEFSIKGLKRAFHKVVAQSVGYQNYIQFYRIIEDASLGTIMIEPDTKLLDEVEVKDEVIPVEQRGDTTIYRADAFKTNPDASAADLVSKMPGVVVSETGVEANGERIQQVLVDGKRFFGQDPLLALNTMPAEAINQVEIFDQLSERSQFTGFDDGNTVKTMNLVTKEDKRNGQFGTLQAGIGTDNRYALEGSFNDFKQQRQLTIMGMSNNVNQKNFTDSDQLGVRGNRRGGNSLFGGSDAQVPVGITRTDGVGINYSNEKKGKWKLESNYFYDRAELNNDEENQRETFTGEDRPSQLYNESSSLNSVNRNHRANIRYEHQINSANSLIFTPSVSIQSNEAEELTDGQTFVANELVNQTENNYQSQSEGYSVNGDLLWRRRFSKRGRTLLWNFGTTLQASDGDDVFMDLNADTTLNYLRSTSESGFRTELSYTEPIGLSSQLQTSYYLEQRSRNSELMTTELASSDVATIRGLSGNLESDILIHRPTLNFSSRSFNRFFGLELALQHTQLQNSLEGATQETTHPSFTKLLPAVYGRFSFGNGATLFARYSTQVATPSTQQLQEVVDNSNPLFFSVGNVDLEQSYTHQFISRVTKANIEKNTSIANLTIVRTTQDYITNAIYTSLTDSVLSEGVTLARGTQISQPLNIDGYWNVRNNTTYSFLISPLKLNMTTGVGFSYLRNPGLTNNIKNISQTYGTNARLTAASNISESVDFNLSYTASHNQITNSVQTERDNDFLRHSFKGSVNLIFGKNFVFRTDITYDVYNGISDSFDTEYALWNASLAKKFLKNELGEISISVFDLLSQNQSVSQEITSAYLQETRASVLEQYFMLSFTYQIRNFKSGS